MYAILNPNGDLWSLDTFETEQEALNYAREQLPWIYPNSLKHTAKQITEIENYDEQVEYLERLNVEF